MTKNQLSHGQNRIWGFGFVISAAVCVLLSVVFAAKPVIGGRWCGAELDSRINPNTAPVASLIRLPGIGRGRAGAIAGYRRGFSSEKPGGPAFRDCDDLQKVRGIGPKTVEKIGRWLKFE